MQQLAGGDLGFVPTMGAFHEGHMQLMREAREHHSVAAVSLFVNPLQFGPNEDLANYPRDEARDFRLADEAGIDIMFAPTVDEIYPHAGTTIKVPDLTTRWEAEIRPGHYDGVATVVAKLFNIVRPRTAYFGWKDLQQCLVIKRMVEDLNMPVMLGFVDTVREDDGLAMSSRNAYLSPEERCKAPQLSRTISRVASEKGSAQALAEARKSLEGDGFLVDYLAAVNAGTLQPLNPQDREGAIIVAARLGKTRLIDNMRFALG